MPVATPDINQPPAALLAMEATPLSQYLAEHGNADRAKLMQQVAVTLSTYHNVHRDIHGDMKMINVVVNADGDAELLKSAATVPITSEPAAPATPEERLPMTTATDVYAFAWLVFQTFTDIDPQELARDPKVMRMIASGAKPNRPGPDSLPAQRGLHEEIWAMLLRCWEISPAARPTITEVVKVFDPAAAPSA
ncbi:hypothetical protein EXIGLDRAFT_716998 [Exidia glandulosa HHB12029]|uniref:Protein kinase domain-containing protein n=1 Tax=Exidia glandulosa HHB12029 TaxID=1314781 RepID=A0A165IKJ7_EXIGL|nr:hypothetical protein EXIGLDRAFT_716998 [Exidia glandulosa HHB12029]